MHLDPIYIWPDSPPDSVGDGPDDRPFLEMIDPDPDADARSAVILCPDGEYAELLIDEAHEVGLWLASLGVRCFVLNYRIAPKYQHPVPLNDIQRAVQWVRANADHYGYTHERIGVMGFGSGGHLAGCAGTLVKRGEAESEDPVLRWNSRPDAMILLYPVVNLLERCPDSIKMNLLGSGFEDVEDTESALDDMLADFGLDNEPKPDQEKAVTKEPTRRSYVSDYEATLSLHMQVNGQTPPAFLVHTVNNKRIPCEHSLLLAKSLREAGIPSEVHLYEEGPAQFGLASRHPHLSTWTGLCARWLQLRGFIGRMGA